jgi:pimeloyl-ACP methyl ester carboxylesterase
MAAPIAQILDQLAIEAAHVVGLSLGGCVALALAIDAPARVRSLVVVNAFARWQTAGVRGAARGVRRTVLAVAAPMRMLATSIAREAFPEAEQASLRDAAVARIAANSRRHYLACLAALVRFDVRDRLGDIRCPTLVVAGGRDATVPFAAQVFLARSIPGARIRVVDESGHVTPGDQPAVLNRLILEHLSRESFR